MARVTLKGINTMAKRLGYRLFRGNGYYYFSTLPGRGAMPLYEEGVYGTSRLGALTARQWIEELENKIKETSARSFD